MLPLARNRGCIRPSGGFTMVEVLIVLAITLITMGIAVPSFSAMTAAQRVKTSGTDLYVSMTRARSEAIKRNTSITLAPKQGGWQNGWTVTDPADATHILDDHGALAGVSATGPASIIYRASGRPLPGSLASMILSATVGGRTFSHCVSLGLSGQPYMKSGASC